jgi:hypothetical protein
VTEAETAPVDERTEALVAVDLGLRTGIAVYGADGRLRTYRSQHFRNRDALRRGVRRILQEAGAVTHLVLEGDLQLGRIWEHAAARMSAAVHRVAPEQWRALLLHPLQRRDGPTAKRSADALAREVIGWSGVARPSSLRHDAAEAVCIGLWGVHVVGWLEPLPALLDPRRRRA